MNPEPDDREFEEFYRFYFHAAVQAMDDVVYACLAELGYEIVPAETLRRSWFYDGDKRLAVRHNPTTSTI